MILNKIFVIIALLGVLMVGFVSAEGWADDLNYGLVSYYDFNNNTLDIYGDNDGVKYGANYINGILGNGLSFDGADDYVDILDDDSLDLNNFSFSLWFNADYQTTGYLINKGQNNNVDEISYRIYLAHFITADTWTNENGRKWLQFAYPTNQWNHMVFVYDGSDEIVYLNGAEVDRVAQYGVTRVTDTNLIFGARSFDNQVITHYKGLMDEIGVWGRALTDKEVAQLWNNGTGIEYSVFESEPTLEERLEILEQRIEELENYTSGPDTRLVELEGKVEVLEERTLWLESQIDKIIDFILNLPNGLSKRFNL